MQQIEWINENGGLDWAASRCDRSAETIYGGPRRRATPRRSWPKPDERSHVVATIDLDDAVDATTVARRAAAATASSTPSRYRKLGRNQLRVALFPAIDPDDVAALTRCIDHVVSALS